jgi:hypothetical protein
MFLSRIGATLLVLVLSAPAAMAGVRSALGDQPCPGGPTAGQQAHDCCGQTLKQGCCDVGSPDRAPATTPQGRTNAPSPDQTMASAFRPATATVLAPASFQLALRFHSPPAQRTIDLTVLFSTFLI